MVYLFPKAPFFGTRKTPQWETGPWPNNQKIGRKPESKAVYGILLSKMGFYSGKVNNFHASCPSLSKHRTAAGMHAADLPDTKLVLFSYLISGRTL